jgi:uncharacterized protein (DUF486 family)
MNHGKPLLAIGKSLGLSMIKFNIWGDQNWRHNYPPFPVLHPFVGITFLIGLITLIIRFFSLLIERIRKGQKSKKLELYAFLLAWFFAMHMPEFMTAEGLPHALRAIGALPVVYIIATLPIIWFLNNTSNRLGLTHIWKYALVCIMLAIIGLFNTVKYHTYWAQEPMQYQSFNANLMRMSAYVNALPSDTEIYIEAGNMERIPIQLFDTTNKDIRYFFPDERASIQPGNASDFAIVLPEMSEDIINEFADQVPTLNIETQGTVGYDQFYVIKP